MRLFYILLPFLIYSSSLHAQYRVIPLKDTSERACFHFATNAFEVEEGVWDIVKLKGTDYEMGGYEYSILFRTNRQGPIKPTYLPLLKPGNCIYPIRCNYINLQPYGSGKYFEILSIGRYTKIRTHDLNQGSSREYQFRGNVLSQNVVGDDKKIFFMQIPVLNDTTPAGGFNERFLYNDSLMLCSFNLNTFNHDTIATFKQPIDSGVSWIRTSGFLKWQPSETTLEFLRQGGLVLEYKFGQQNFTDTSRLPWPFFLKSLTINSFLNGTADTQARRFFIDSLPGTEMKIIEKNFTLDNDSLIELNEKSFRFNYALKQRFKDSHRLVQSEYLPTDELVALWNSGAINEERGALHSFLTVLDTTKSSSEATTIPLMLDSMVSDYKWFDISEEYILIGGGAKIDYHIGDWTPCSNAYLLEIPLSQVRSPKMEASIQIYPNPAFDQVTIENADLELLQIHDLSGKRIKKVLLTPQEQYRIPVAELDGGLYILSAHTVEGEWKQEKFIKVSR